MATKKHTNKKEAIFIIGFFLLIISFVLFNYEDIILISSEINNDIISNIYKEKTKLDTQNTEVNIDVDYVDDDSILIKDRKDKTNNYKYIGFLEIDKINLNLGFLSKSNYYNQVNFNIQVIDISDMPDVVNGNLILAAHSGAGEVAYFKNLYKLSTGDICKIYYKGKVYKYKITNIYLEDKDGAIKINRDINKTTLTLVTCTFNDKKHQTIYISELIGVESY